VLRLEHTGDRLAGRLTLRRLTVSAMPGASWRSAFNSRSTPLVRVAEPISTGQMTRRAALWRDVEHLVARRRNVFEQLLHQFVVVIGQRFEHGEARFLAAIAFSPSSGTFGRGKEARFTMLETWPITTTN